MSEVTSDHAQRLTTITQVLKIVQERLQFLEGKTVVIEPKVNTLETELVKAARDIAANDAAMKEIVDVNDKHVKDVINKLDQDIKAKLDEMRRAVETVSAQEPLSREPSRSWIRGH